MTSPKRSAPMAPAPLAPVSQVDALSYLALLALWHRKNLEAAEAQAQAVEESIHLFSDWRNPLESCRDYVDYYESSVALFNDAGQYCGCEVVRT